MASGKQIETANPFLSREEDGGEKYGARSKSWRRSGSKERSPASATVVVSSQPPTDRGMALSAHLESSEASAAERQRRASLQYSSVRGAPNLQEAFQGLRCSQRNPFSRNGDNRTLISLEPGLIFGVRLEDFDDTGKVALS